MQEAERQRRFQEEERRRSAERRALAAGVASAAPQRDSGYRSANVTQGTFSPAADSYASPNMGQILSSSLAPSQQPSQPVSTAQARREPTSAGAASTLAGAGYASTALPDADPAASARPQSQNPKARGSSLSQGNSRPVQAQPPSSTRGIQASQPQASRVTSTASQAPQAATTGAAGMTRDTSSASRPPDTNKSTFPHAFERWETLSSHFEGLTSYWIRRMEQNNEEIRRDPISQQMSRQITDLSAAGANLFHAVVELQRLRASSERKFQRWFFETRADQERSRETQAQLQSALDAERQARAEETQTYQQAAVVSSDQQMQDLKRELQICKDEARRAWEELGQREQLDRERTFKLRDGYAVDIGGIQVVPQAMMSQEPSMGRPSTHGTTYASAPATSGLQTQGLPPSHTYAEEASPTETDPFSGSGPPPMQTVRPAPTSATHDPYTSTTAHPTISAGPARSVPITSTRPSGTGAGDPERYYRAAQGLPYSAAHGHEPPTAASRQTPATLSENESDDGFALDDRGNVMRDERGNPIPFRTLAALQRRQDDPSPIAEELSSDATREQQRAQTYGRSESSRRVPQTSDSPTVSGQRASQSAPHSSTYATQHPPPRSQERPDYSGAGYGDMDNLAGPEEELPLGEDEGDAEGEWGAVPSGMAGTRHHHPTRLSDVLEEEDERSGGGMSGRDSQIF